MSDDIANCNYGGAALDAAFLATPVLSASMVKAGKAISSSLDIAGISKKIGHGHALSKHGIKFGVTKGSELSKIAEGIMNDPKIVVEGHSGRKAFINNNNDTIVVLDPNHKDFGTIFKPGSKYNNALDYINKRFK